MRDSLAITAALSLEQRQAILERWNRLNPQQAGAEVPDVLEMLYDSDSDLDRTEPFFEAHPDLQDSGKGLAARALIWSGTELTWENVTSLLATSAVEHFLDTSDDDGGPFEPMVIKNRPAQLPLPGTRLELALERICPTCRGTNHDPAGELPCLTCYDLEHGVSHGVVRTPAGRAIQEFLVRWGVKP